MYVIYMYVCICICVYMCVPYMLYIYDLHSHTIAWWNAHSCLCFTVYVWCDIYNIYDICMCYMYVVHQQRSYASNIIIINELFFANSSFLATLPSCGKAVFWRLRNSHIPDKGNWITGILCKGHPLYNEAKYQYASNNFRQSTPAQLELQQSTPAQL